MKPKDASMPQNDPKTTSHPRKPPSGYVSLSVMIRERAAVGHGSSSSTSSEEQLPCVVGVMLSLVDFSERLSTVVRGDNAFSRIESEF